MKDYDEKAAAIAGDEEFCNIQEGWLLDYTSEEIAWSVLEPFISHFNSALNDVLISLNTLQNSGGIAIDRDILKHLKAKYIEGVMAWRNPSLLSVSDTHFQNVSDCIAKIEKNLKISDASLKKWKLARSRRELRKENIKLGSYNILFITIKNRFKKKYGRGGVKKFVIFFEERILQKPNRYNFLFAGKNKSPSDFEAFKPIGNTFRRNKKKARKKDPRYFKIDVLLDHVNAQRKKP